MHRIRVILSGLLCLGLLAACSGPPAQNQSGNLQLTITGLPETAAVTQALTPNATADVTVTGPGDFSRSVTESTTLTDLTPGTYTVAADAVTEGGVTYTPDPATQQVTVTAGATASASVSYSEASEPDYGLSLSETSLSTVRGESVQLEVTLERSGGFSEDVTLSLEDAPAGVSGEFSTTLLTGSIASSTLTLEVDASTAEGSYELSVVGTAGSETREASFTLTVSSVTVSGTVVDVLGQPLGNVSVKLGSQTTTTASDGSFTLSGTAIPYDITVYSFTDQWADTFIGLTRSDPILQVLGSGGITAPVNEAEISGTLSGGAGFPNPADTETRVAFGAPDTRGFGSTTLFDAEGPAYPTFPPFTVSWLGSSTVSGRLHALQVTTNASGFPATYQGYGSRDVSFTDGGTFPNQDITLGGALSTSSLSGQVQNLPMGFELTIGSLMTLDAETSLTLFSSDPGAPQNFSFLTPDLPNSSHTVLAQAFSSSNETVLAWETGVAPNASSVTLVLPDAPPQPISPSDGATGVTVDTSFTFDSPIAGAITIMQFSPTGGSTGPTFNVITSGEVGRVPDLSAEGLGLPAGANYRWGVTSLAPFTDMDEGAGNFLTDLFLLASGGGPGPTRDIVAGAGSFREFMTAP